MEQIFNLFFEYFPVHVIVPAAIFASIVTSTLDFYIEKAKGRKLIPVVCALAALITVEWNGFAWVELQKYVLNFGVTWGAAHLFYRKLGKKFINKLFSAPEQIK